MKLPTIPILNPPPFRFEIAHHSGMKSPEVKRPLLALIDPLLSAFGRSGSDADGEACDAPRARCDEAEGSGAFDPGDRAAGWGGALDGAADDPPVRGGGTGLAACGRHYGRGSG